jgi:hypothetical protein
MEVRLAADSGKRKSRSGTSAHKLARASPTLTRSSIDKIVSEAALLFQNAIQIGCGPEKISFGPVRLKGDGDRSGRQLVNKVVN